MADSVELKNLVKNFSDFRAVDNLSLKINGGEFLSLLGPSGCGKTTTLRMIAGLTNPDEGTITIGSEIVNDKAVHKRNIGMVFQSYALFPHMSVSENIGFGLKNKGYAKKEILRKTGEVLELVQLTGIENRFPRQLSGGQQQRVALARAIVIEPSVLLLDEPMSNLDAKLRERMRIELKQLQEKLGITTIYVTHDQIEALTMSDRVVIMNRGRIEQIGSPMEVYKFPSTQFVANFIGRSNFLRGKLVSSSLAGAEVLTEKGLRIVVPPQDIRLGEEVYVAIRPERIQIIGKDEGKTSFMNECRGRIEFIAYLGASTHYQVVLDGGDNLIIEEQNISGLPVRRKDEIMRLGWDPEDCLLTNVPSSLFEKTQG